jgi:hypothetical protein
MNVSVIKGLLAHLFDKLLVGMPDQDKVGLHSCGLILPYSVWGVIWKILVEVIRGCGMAEIQAGPAQLHGLVHRKSAQITEVLLVKHLPHIVTRGD